MKVKPTVPEPRLISENDVSDLAVTNKAKVKEAMYPYKEQINRILDSYWIGIIIITIVLAIDPENSFYYFNSEDFFYPCNYANMISINDALQLQARLNETEYEIQSYKLLLSENMSTVTENDKNNLLLLQNATEQSLLINEEFNYHKNHWKECFKTNYIYFYKMLVNCQLCLTFFGVVICSYEIFQFLQYTSKLKQMILTEEQNKAYEKDWKGTDGIKFKFVLKCIMLVVIIALFLLFLLVRIVKNSRSGEIMPFFN